MAWLPSKAASRGKDRVLVSLPHGSQAEAMNHSSTGIEFVKRR